jgi:hypothetical protein
MFENSYWPTNDLNFLFSALNYVNTGVSHSLTWKLIKQHILENGRSDVASLSLQEAEGCPAKDHGNVVGYCTGNKITTVSKPETVFAATDYLLVLKIL